MRDTPLGAMTGVAIVAASFLVGCSPDERLNTDDSRASSAPGSEEVRRAFTAFIDALNRGETQTIEALSCELAPSIPPEPRTTTVVDVRVITIEGANARVDAETVHSAPGESASDAEHINFTWNFVREAGTWKYCPLMWERGAGG
ncbi:hypothetical protein [Williamsia sp. 1135]|uniref:hypothetical protein n=1 Tax=Williamsia sp. 1135 TaxID=1889262 RepID=UPI001180CE1F|nr:hypothetical protein [Williamsia sp. 1135]